MSRTASRPSRRLRFVITVALTGLVAGACSSSPGSGSSAGPGGSAGSPASGVATQGTRDPAALGVEAVSTKADYVSGGDVTVAILPPAGSSADASTATLTVGGKPATARMGKDRRGRTIATLSGLADGANEIVATLGSSTASLTVTNHPVTGPLFSGPKIPMPVCSTEAYDLGPATDADCSAPTKVRWRYRATDGSTKALPDPTAKPADLATIADGPNKGKAFIVREEQGVINRGIYWINVLDPEPGAPAGAATPWNDSGWNGRLVYQFGGGCGTTYTQGFLLLNSAPMDVLALGYATATSTLNTYQVMCNDVLSAETALMVKEHFAETYGPPVYTIGSGGSGGAIQQYLIAYNYPGILDAVGATLPFPDAFSIAPGVVDCMLLNAYYRSDAGKGLSEAQRGAINGQASTKTCDFWESTFAQNIRPDSGCALDILANAGDMIKGLPQGTGGGSGLPKLPADKRYDPATNRSGLRCTMQDSMVNQLGKDPATGFARRPVDNTGVLYGLSALNAGTITPDQFLDLNERIGGTDVDGRPTKERMTTTADVIRPVYESGRVIEGGGPLDTVPIITVNVYTDDLGDIHDRFRAFSVRERLKRPDGSMAPNHMVWTRGVPKGQTLIDALTGTVDVGTELVTVLDDWLTALDKDTGSGDRTAKLERSRPAKAIDNCLAEDGTRISGLDIYDTPGPCRDRYPVHGDPRTAAGAPLRNDIGKCQLQPAANAFDGAAKLITVPFAEAQRQRFASLFAAGVCDWSKPGVGQVPSKGPWQDFGH